jgi:transposase
MLMLPPSVRIFLCVSPVDMRRSFDTLSGLVEEYLGEDPLSGHLFVFRNREETKIKIVYWDGDGYAIWYKRLERGTFALPKAATAGVEIETSVFSMILGGMDSKSMSKKKRFKREKKRELVGAGVSDHI